MFCDDFGQIKNRWQNVKYELNGMKSIILLYVNVGSGKTSTELPRL
jgi:hypothetical protein